MADNNGVDCRYCVSGFEDSGVELPGAAPSADTAFKDAAYDVTIAATQTFNNGL